MGRCILNCQPNVKTSGRQSTIYHAFVHLFMIPAKVLVIMFGCLWLSPYFIWFHLLSKTGLSTGTFHLCNVCVVRCFSLVKAEYVDVTWGSKLESIPNGPQNSLVSVNATIWRGMGPLGSHWFLQVSQQQFFSMFFQYVIIRCFKMVKNWNPLVTANWRFGNLIQSGSNASRGKYPWTMNRSMCAIDTNPSGCEGIRPNPPNYCKGSVWKRSLIWMQVRT